MRPIHLRILGRRNKNQFFAICLETDVAVEGHSLDEIEHKMRDALLAYFESFSPEELTRGEFLRKAPLYYRVAWNCIRAIRTVKELNAIIFFGDYDPASNRLNIA